MTMAFIIIYVVIALILVGLLNLFITKRNKKHAKIDADTISFSLSFFLQGELP